MKQSIKRFLAFSVLLVLTACSHHPAVHLGDKAQLEVAFEPESGAENLILKAIGAAKHSIRLSAFAFSSPEIVSGLVEAKLRGVDVKVVVDYRHNIVDDSKGIGRKALTQLANANIAVRTNGLYRIHHDKFLIVDGLHVQTGSYNYAESANKDSENVLVVWNEPALARQYLKHWQARFDEGTPFIPE